LLKQCLLVTYIIISFISSTIAYNAEELRRSTEYAVDWLVDEGSDFNSTSARTYLNFVDENDLSVDTPSVESIKNHFYKSPFKQTLQNGASWDELNTFFDVMLTLEREVTDDPLNLKACQLLTTAVTKSLISLCIKNSQEEIHPILREAKTAWTTFIGSDLRKHLSSLDIR
jgi:hypothetical protein